jgi:outer membrane lipoprotein SlyB
MLRKDEEKNHRPTERTIGSKNMKLNILIVALAGSAVILTGCQYPNGEPNNTGTGALTGGAIGAASGAAINGRNPGAGALIGGAIGAVAGGLIGNSMDQQQREYLRTQAPQTYARVDQGRPLSVADVKALARAGIGEDVIISEIRNSHTVYHLSTADIIDLRDSGVTDKVLNFMINTANLPGGNSEVAPQTTVVDTAPPPAPVETVVVAPGPGNVWIDGEWMWNGGWIWVAGHWGYPPYSHAVWVRSYWYHGSYGWRKVPGCWR